MSKWGGRRKHIEATKRFCRKTGAEFTANKKGEPDCRKGKWRIEVKAWKSGRCLDLWYYRREVAKGRNWIVVPCWSDKVARQAKKNGVRLSRLQNS